MDEFNKNDPQENEDTDVNSDNIETYVGEINTPDNIDKENSDGSAEAVFDDELFDETAIEMTSDTENLNEPQYYEEAVNDYTNTTNNTNQQYIPDFSYAEPRPERVKNRGLKVFCFTLALVLIISLSVSAGYFVAVYNGATSNTSTITVPKLELEDRPDNDSEIFSDYSEVFASVNESVVNIMVYSPTDSSNVGSASGVIYSKDGYIVTNDHIYEGIPNAKFLVRLSNGKEYKASFVAGDTRSDLAVIKINDKVNSLKVATFGNSNDVFVGEQVITVGYPSSYGDEATLTHGIISAVNRRVTNTTTSYASSFLQTDAAINPGNSGGALANMYGQVVGITSSKLAGDAYDAVSYAIPTVTMKKVVTSLIKDGCVTNRAKLGITYTEVNSLTAEANDVPVGVYIGTISSDSDLYNRGFDEGDIITHVNGTEITNSDILLDVIENSNAGDSIELTIYKTKDKTSDTLSVKLLADKGSSSYNSKNTTESSDNNFGFDDFSGFGNSDSSQPDSDDKSDSSKTFDFPLN